MCAFKLPERFLIDRASMKLLQQLYVEGRILFYQQRYSYGVGVYRIFIRGGKSLLVKFNDNKLEVYEGKVNEHI